LAKPAPILLILGQKITSSTSAVSLTKIHQLTKSDDPNHAMCHSQSKIEFYFLKDENEKVNILKGTFTAL
jgi:hypothetical protein